MVKTTFAGVAIVVASVVGIHMLHTRVSGPECGALRDRTQRTRLAEKIYHDRTAANRNAVRGTAEARPRVQTRYRIVMVRAIGQSIQRHCRGQSDDVRPKSAVVREFAD